MRKLIPSEQYLRENCIKTVDHTTHYWWVVWLRSCGLAAVQTSAPASPSQEELEIRVTPLSGRSESGYRVQARLKESSDHGIVATIRDFLATL